MSNGIIYIYCLATGHKTRGGEGDVIGVALAEDGECLARHLSSGPGFAKCDMGITGKSKHDRYAAKYPEGYTLEWIDEKDLDNHEGFQAAYIKNGE